MNHSHATTSPVKGNPRSAATTTIDIRAGLLATVFLLGLCCAHGVSAAIITSSLGNTTSGLNDGDIPPTFLLGSIQSGQAAPFDQGCGSDVLASIGNCSASWTFSYGVLAEPIISASLSIGIVDHDSNASGSQLLSYGLDGNDLTASLDALFEESGDGLDGMYNVYTIDLTGFFAALTDGSASVSIALQGPGLITPLFPLPGPNPPTETATNGANLIYSSLSIETQPAQPVPEPGSLVLATLGLLGIGIFRRRRAVTGARMPL